MNKMTFATVKKENEFEHFMFNGLDRNIYSKYLGRIKISYSEKDSKDIIFSKEEAHIFKKSNVKRYMHIADPNSEE
jgi:catabolite regulation protein CreA